MLFLTDQKISKFNSSAHTSSKSTDKVCASSDHQNCRYWSGLGYCNPSKSFYKTMVLKCKGACNLCGGELKIKH